MEGCSHCFNPLILITWHQPLNPINDFASFLKHYAFHEAKDLLMKKHDRI